MWVTQMFHRIPFYAVVFFTLLNGALILGQEGGEVDSRELYLISGTPTNYGAETFPSVLYQVDAIKRLKAVRELVAQSDGVHSIHTSGDVIFVAYPHITPTATSIVHVDEPLRRDDVVFNSPKLFVNDTRVTMAMPQNSSTDELFALSDDVKDPSKWTLASVSGDVTGKSPRVKLNDWNEYADLQVDGAPGGPGLSAALVGSVVGGSLAISFPGRSIKFDSIPPPLQATTKKIAPVILAANQDYIIVAVQRTFHELASAKPRDTAQLLVHDRSQNVWKSIRIVGNASNCRIFGPWLAIRVAFWYHKPRVSPGRERERNTGTDRLPNVQDEYSSSISENYWRSGTQVLQNLSDGRIIRIETGQEDSEILLVDKELVLYRVNDTIYQAKIAGDKIQDSAILVKDDDVPEIHWVFWGRH